LKGYRKLIFGIFSFIFGLILILLGKFDTEVKEFIIWLYGIFSSTNIFEHITEKIKEK